MIILLVVLAVLALLAAGVALSDRAIAALAERKASDALSAPLGHAVVVRVIGTPFLPQALRGRYTSVEVTGSLRVGEIVGATFVGYLTRVYLPLRDLLGRRVRELPCEHVEGRVVLPYGELARIARIPGLDLHFEGERLLASAALPIPDVPGFGPVPGIGQLARVSGEAVLTLRGAGEVWLRIRGVSVAGFGLPDLVLSQLVPSLNVPIPLPPMPFGLRLDELRPTAGGLVVDGSADAVVFRASEAPVEPAHRDPAPSPAPGPALRSGPARAPRPTGRDERPDA